MIIKHVRDVNQNIVVVYYVIVRIVHIVINS